MLCGDICRSLFLVFVNRLQPCLGIVAFVPILAKSLRCSWAALHLETVKYSGWNQVTRARGRNIGWRLDDFFVSPDLWDTVVSADIHT